jgi:O-antigen/teichoic acid export membrane protein
MVAGSKALAGASVVVLNLWVARHLSPSVYGVFALAVACLMLMDGVVGTALDAAVIQRVGVPGAPATAAERAGIGIKVVIGTLVCLLATLVMFLVAPPEVAVVTAIAGLGGIGLLAHRSVLVYFQVRERFVWYTAADLAQTSLRCALIAAALVWGYRTATIAVAAYAAAPWLIAIAMLAFFVDWRSRQGAAGPGVSSPELHSVARSAALALATTGVGAVVARLDLLMIGVAGSPSDAGIFAAASTLALVPTWLGAYLAPTFSGRIVPYCRAGQMRRFFTDVQRLLLIVALSGLLAGVAIAPSLITRFLPPAYAVTASVFPVLLAAGIAGFVTFPLVLHTLLFLSPRTYLVMDLASLPLLIPLYVIAARRFGALGVAWVTTISTVVKAAIAQTAAISAIKTYSLGPRLDGDVRASG